MNSFTGVCEKCYQGYGDGAACSVAWHETVVVIESRLFSFFCGFFFLHYRPAQLTQAFAEIIPEQNNFLNRTLPVYE